MNKKTEIEKNSRPEQFVTQLEELLDFGSKEISKVTLNLTRTTPRKSILYSMMGAIQNYASGILYLLKVSRTSCAEVLLRSLIESFIKLQFIFIGRSQKNALRFLIHDLFDRKKLAEDVIEFSIRRPDVDTILPQRDWEKFADEKKKEINYIKKKYPYQINNLPKLKELTKQIDEEKEKRTGGDLKGSMEWWYLSLYWYLSKITHMDARGLNTFITKDSYGNYMFNLLGTPEDAVRIVVATYGVYLYVLDNYLKRFGGQSKSLKQYKAIFKSYTKIKPEQEC